MIFSCRERRARAVVREGIRIFKALHAKYPDQDDAEVLCTGKCFHWYHRRSVLGVEKFDRAARRFRKIPARQVRI